MYDSSMHGSPTGPSACFRYAPVGARGDDRVRISRCRRADMLPRPLPRCSGPTAMAQVSKLFIWAGLSLSSFIVRAP